MALKIVCISTSVGSIYSHIGSFSILLSCTILHIDIPHIKMMLTLSTLAWDDYIWFIIFPVALCKASYFLTGVVHSQPCVRREGPITVSADRLAKSPCPRSQFLLRTSVSRLAYAKNNGLVDTGLYAGRCSQVDETVFNAIIFLHDTSSRNPFFLEPALLSFTLRSAILVHHGDYSF